ncbi:MAG: hypothetical protein JSS20_22475, partial [Proteobacteria bacterium]|nr:hypothetical protein [Pseudomonadota bacterium]
VAESAASSQNDRRLRDEIWFKGREWFAAKDCCIPLDLAKTAEDQAIIEQMIAELTTVTFDHDDNGMRVVERKKDMKKRLGHSPDLADGFLLTFVGGSFPRTRDDHGRHDDFGDDSDDLAEAWAA